MSVSQSYQPHFKYSVDTVATSHVGLFKEIISNQIKNGFFSYTGYVPSVL